VLIQVRGSSSYGRQNLIETERALFGQLEHGLKGCGIKHSVILNLNSQKPTLPIRHQAGSPRSFINLARSSALVICIFCSLPVVAQEATTHYDYRVLATSRTGTMEREMNEAADSGFVFGGLMGGQTAFGGKEVLVIMKKNITVASSTNRKYKLLATSRTGTMQKELQQAGDEGFVYCGMT
jgi:hypothetical protein